VDRKAYLREYNKSEKGKARYKKWEQSETGKTYRKRQYERQRAILDFYKHIRGCKYCRENCPGALTFEYRNPEEKTLDLNQVNGCYKWGDVLQELSKVEVICLNCRERQIWQQKIKQAPWPALALGSPEIAS
jgi:ferredoxin